jgi:hypothetical protein
MPMMEDARERDRGSMTCRRLALSPTAERPRSGREGARLGHASVERSLSVAQLSCILRKPAVSGKSRFAPMLHMSGHRFSHVI